MDIFRVTNLTVGPFNKFSISFKVNSFSIITGSNSSGKSLLIKVLGGLVSTTNRVFYDDKPLESVTSSLLNKEVALILDDFSLLANTVLEEIRRSLEYLEVDEVTINKLTKDISKDLKLTSLLEKEIEELSYYEKLKVFLAANLVCEPKVLLIDDVDKYLNYKEKEEFVGILNHLQTMGLTIIMTSSSLDMAVDTVNATLYILDKGKIVSSGEVFEVLSNDSLINKTGLELPFMVDLCVKLKYYNLVDKIVLNPLRLVDILWK